MTRDRPVTVRPLAVVVIVATALAFAATGVAPGGSVLVSSVTAQEEPRPSGYDELRHGIELHPNGSATWTVEYRYRLDGEDAGEEWAELRADIENREPAYREGFESRWERALVAAENDTDREMDVTPLDLDVEESTTPPEYGYVRYRFKWTSFASVEVNRIDAGDAIEGLDLDDRSRMVVSWPDSYDPRDNDSIAPAPDDRRESAVVWDGAETEFLEEEPRLVLIEGDPEPEEADRSIPFPWLAALGAVLLAIAGLGGWLVGRSEDATPTEPPEETDDGQPRELLSNEEQVLRLLEERDGRIKQQAVVAELGWTEAKTSQVVGELRQSGAIEVFRIGRENVLTLPEETEE